MPITEQEAQVQMRQIFDAAVNSAMPGPAVLKHLPPKPKGRCIVIGAGKASAAMAAAIDKAWPEVELSGVLSTRYDHAVTTQRIKIIEAGHPVPDQASEQAAREILTALDNLSADDLVIALISGGGSATLALPVDGITLADKQQLGKALLASGANIEEINSVRQHLSKVKGGALLAAAAPASVHSLLISDIPGDKPGCVASGPTFAPITTAAEALAILRRYEIDVPNSVIKHLNAAQVHCSIQTRHQYEIIANPAQALYAAADKAKQLGYTPIILGDAIEGESAELGKVMAGIAASVKSMGQPVKMPAALISGGETTVTIGQEGAGRGGRNTEFLLSLAVALKGAAGIFALAGDSDGIDGTEDAAGAIITPSTLAQAKAAGLVPFEVLKQHDSYSLFKAIDALVITGPTLTNVNDIRIVLIVER